MVEFKSMKFDQYKQTITNMINADFAEDQERIKIVIKSKAEQAKIIDKEHLKLFKKLEICLDICLEGKVNHNFFFVKFVASSGFYSFNTHYYVCSLIQPASLLHTFLLY